MRWFARAPRPSSSEQRWSVGASPVVAGVFTYGLRRIKVREYGEGAALKIGKFCSLARGVEIVLGGNHRVDWITTFPFGHVFRDEFGPPPHPGHPATKGDVLIGNDVWIGAGAVIFSGVNVGDGAVIASRAVVARDVEPYAVVAGNPAQLVRRRFSPEVISLLLDLAWWDLPVSDIQDIIPILSAEPAAAQLRDLLRRYRGRD